MSKAFPFKPATHAWTLIEMVGILAVLAILAALLLPALIRERDKSVADQEKATLKSFADAFQQYVLTTRVIPDQTTWYSAVASQLGFGTNDILYNVRQQSHLQPRVFLISPSLGMGFGTNVLPYVQSSYVITPTDSGIQCPVQPTNVLVMIVSSLGMPLPSAVVSGVFSPAHPEYFDNLWTNADGTMPPGGAWTGWNGNPADIIVQRINLAPLFVRLFVSQFNSSVAYYGIDGASPTNVPPRYGIDGYFIEGSVLTLYTNSNPLNPGSSVPGEDTRQILSRASSFVLDNEVWRGSLSGAPLGAGVMNIGDVVQQFLNAPPNVSAQNSAGNAQQKLVVRSMLNYMSNYNVWAIQYNYNNAALKNQLITVQGNMMSTIQGLYNGAYFPTNPTACLQ